MYAILNALKSTCRIHVDLPSLGDAAAPDSIRRYSATTLTHLYLTCYQQQLWDLCDVVTDTWIRAFHARRHAASQMQKGSVAAWRRNRALERLRRSALAAQRRGEAVPAEYDVHAPVYALDVSDPELEASVTDTNVGLLNTLYAHTRAPCGARLMWADALALGGDRTDEVLERAEKRGEKLNRDLVFDTMQSTLRLVRRKRTLKIEEAAEGAWCARYHEHGRWGMQCYRERASKQETGGEGEDMMDVEMEEGRAAGKSVRFGDEDEYDSEEE